MNGKVKFSYTYEEIGINGKPIKISDTFELDDVSFKEAEKIFYRFKKETLNSHLSGLGDSNSEDLAAIFNVSVNTILNWVKRDGMPIVLKDNKGYKFNRETVFEWIRENKKPYVYLIKRYEDRIKSQK